MREGEVREARVELRQTDVPPVQLRSVPWRRLRSVSCSSLRTAV